MTRLIIGLFGFVTLLTTGCSSIYFYETEKFSLSLEGRGDPSNMVKANLGFDQRVALIAPVHDITEEAPTFISDFQLQLKNSDGLVVNSVILSGDALGDQGTDITQAQNALQGITGGKARRTTFNLLKTAFGALNGSDPQQKKLQADMETTASYLFDQVVQDKPKRVYGLNVGAKTLSLDDKSTGAKTASNLLGYRLALGKSITQLRNATATIESGTTLTNAPNSPNAAFQANHPLFKGLTSSGLTQLLNSLQTEADAFDKVFYAQPSVQAFVNHVKSEVGE